MYGRSATGDAAPLLREWPARTWWFDPTTYRPDSRYPLGHATGVGEVQVSCTVSALPAHFGRSCYVGGNWSRKPGRVHTRGFDSLTFRFALQVGHVGPPKASVRGSTPRRRTYF